MSNAASATATRVTSTGTTTAAHPRPAVARWVTLTTARAATKTPTSRARYPFTDIRTSSSRLGPFPTWWYRVPAGPVEPPATVDVRRPGGLDVDRGHLGPGALRAVRGRAGRALPRPAVAGRARARRPGGRPGLRQRRADGPAPPAPGGRRDARPGQLAGHAGAGVRAARRPPPVRPRRLVAPLNRGGQLAVQMPANHAPPPPGVPAEVPPAEPFRAALDGYRRE